MGISIMYSAIPPSSILYARLQHEKAFSILVNDLFTYGSGIFRFFEIDPEEIDEILEGVIEAHQDVFDSTDKVDQIIAEFRLRLDKIRQAYPGIEDRRAVIEKSVNEIEECLVQQFKEK